MGAILGSHPQVRYRFQPLHSYTFTPSLDATAPRKEVHTFLAALWETADSYVTSESLSGETVSTCSSIKNPAESYLLFKEVRHLPTLQNASEQDPLLKLLAIVRDPLDVLESWINAPREWKEKWSIGSEWLNASSKNSEYSGNHYGVAEWANTTKALVQFEETYPSKCKIFRYGEFVNQPEETFHKAQIFLGLEPTSLNEALRISGVGRPGDPYGIIAGLHDSPLRRLVPPEISHSARKFVVDSGLEPFLDKTPKRTP